MREMRVNSRLATSWLWKQFKHSRLWYALRRIGVLRSAVYLVIELEKMLREPLTCSVEAVDRDLKRRKDPWNYETNPTEHRRFQDQTALLDAVCKGGHFGAGLEIGCA